MCRHNIAKFTARNILLRHVVWIVVILAVRPSLSRAAPSIFDDDWKPATLPANHTEPKTDQPESQHKAAPTAVTPRHGSLPPEPKPIAQRVPIPEKKELAPTRKLFRELFQKDLADGSSGARHALALKLMGEGARCQDKPLDQYVLLAAAYQAALDAQDLGLCFDAIDDLSGAFAVDGLALKAQALIAGGLKGATPAAGYDHCRAGLLVLIGLIDAEDYVTAGKLARLLQPAATGDPFLKPVIAKWTKTLEFSRISHDKYAKARERLRLAPDDAAAKEDVGVFLCFCKGNWERGLPWLAEGAQRDIQSLAKSEMNGPTQPDSLQQLAAGWMTVGGKEADGYREKIREHAIELYGRARSGSTGLQKRAIELSIQKVQAAIGSQWIDLLELADSDKDAKHGTWSRSGITLITIGDHDRLELPYAPPAEYAFRVDFTPGGNVDTVFMGIVKGGKVFRWMMGNNGNEVANFEWINGKGLDGNKTVRKFKLIAGRRYTAVIEVFNNRLKAFVDGELLVEWPTDYHEFSVDANGAPFRAVDPSKLAIGDWTTKTVFHRIEVMELSGSGTVLR
jgi:hypothetical protein